ncbi:MAG: hypothetical protein ACOY93_15745 [Bacillota bacterium]
MTDSEQAKHPRARRTGADAEFTQHMVGDGATGGNTAYGNSPGNQGARLVDAGPEEDQPGHEEPRG